MVTSPSIETPRTTTELDAPLNPDGRYRPHLDGLRAVAVYLVVLFHAGSSWFSGGYIGVDVFFVLSGYLVTQLLLRDVAARGSIRFGRFYARRYRRLLPAAFVTLLVTAMVYTAIASPADVVASVNGFKAAFLYVANWFFIHRSTAYFGGNISQNPVLQFWSLAVEEQFYLVWPFLLTGLFVVTNRRRATQRRTIRIIVAVGAVASLAWALWLRTRNPAHAYYGTDTRAYELFAGALIALTPSIAPWVGRVARRARGLSIVAIVALVFFASDWVHFDAIQRGLAATITTFVLLVALEGAGAGIVHRALSSDSAVYLGKVSYGTYLWHWPVVLVLVTSFHLSTLSTIALTGLIATSLASLSFELLEHRVRVSRFLDRSRRIVIVAGLAISIVSAVVIIPAILDRGSSSSATASATATAAGTPIPKNLDLAHATFSSLVRPPDCYQRPPSACTLVHGTGRHLLLLGDSHAQMLIPTFTAIAERENLTLSVIAIDACPWQRHLYTTAGTADCKKRKEDAYDRVIPALHPDVIVAINFGFDDPSIIAFPVLGENQRRVGRGSPEFELLMETVTRASAEELTADGADLVIVEPVPIAKVDPTACLVKAQFLEQCRYVVSTTPSPIEKMYQALAAGNPHIVSANFDQLVCPFLPICDPVIAGHIVKVDGHHLTVEYATYISGDVDNFLKANRLIP